MTHTINGLKEIQEKRLSRSEEIGACRHHINSLKSTMSHMSNISKMTEMYLLMAALEQLLEVVSQHLSEIERKSLH